MTPTLRAAQLADIPNLIRARLSFLVALGLDIEPQIETEAAQQIETFLLDHLDRDLFCYIVVEGETLVAAGFLQVIEVMWQPLAPTGRYGRIINILTLPHYRRRGLARKIMRKLLLKASELDLAYLDLDASPEGQPLYESLGFALTQARHPPMRLFLK